MSWLKRTVKKAGRAVGNVAKISVNLAAAPVTAWTKKPLISHDKIKGEGWQKASKTATKINDVANKTFQIAAATYLTAGAAGAALGAGSGIAGGAAGLVGKAGSAIGGLLKGAKVSKIGSTVGSLFKKGGTVSNVASKVKNVVSKAKNTSDTIKKFMPAPPAEEYVPVGSPTTTTAAYLNGSAEGEGLLNSFIPADSRVGKIVNKLPSLGSIIGGAADGAVETLQQSEAGKELENQAVKNWFEANMAKIMGSIIGILVLIMGYWGFKKK